MALSLWGALLFATEGQAQATELTGDGSLVAPSAEAPREETYETARGVGMGLGARATAQGTSALAYNAANIGMAQLYHIETMASFVPGDRAWMYGGAIVDSITSKMAAGLSFHGFYGSGDRALRGYDGRLALGLPLSQKIGLGLSARYINLRSRQENSDGESVGAGVKAFTLDASIRVTPVDGLHIALLGNNLIRTDSPLAPLTLGGGLGYAFGNLFSVSGDILVDLTTFEQAELLFGVGIEYLAGESFPLRVGYRRDQGRVLNQITASVGYVDQQFGMDIALRQDIAYEPGNDTQLLLNIRYHVQ
ncbi:MAG: hypothetical protein CMN30_24790 [Sandaracinus sp.]|nr:hypothetical protein [Sandaracinus sp.]